MTFLPPDQAMMGWRQKTDKYLRERNDSQTRQPSIPHPLGPASTSPGVIGWWDNRFGTVTGGFVDAWTTRVPVLVRQAIFCNLPLSNTPGAASQWRLRITDSAAVQLAVSGFYDAPLGSNRNWRLEWLHGLPLWTTVNVIISVQINVTVITTPVSDVVDIFIPYGGAIAQRIPVRATTDGLLPGGL